MRVGIKSLRRVFRVGSLLCRLFNRVGEGRFCYLRIRKVRKGMV